MTIFATPDFGASATLGGLLVLAWAVLLVLVLGGVAWGLWLLKGGSPVRKRWGLFLLLVSGLVPLCCCLGPPRLFHQQYGSYPSEHAAWRTIEPGMTAEEVTATLGPPHARHGEGQDERWVYYLDSFEIGWRAIAFGPDGKVDHTYGN